MRSRSIINGCVFLLSVSAISLSVRYAVARESLRETNLNAVYWQLNQEFFQGQLSRAEVRWDNLTAKGESGETYQCGDDSFLILIDRETNTTEDDMRSTLEHEACHVLTREAGREHGAVFQECMTRFGR